MFAGKPFVEGPLYTKTGESSKVLIFASKHDFFRHKHFPLNGYYTTKVLAVVSAGDSSLQTECWGPPAVWREVL